jgi:hypothetical protein
MILNKIEDPRSSLQKARRFELLAFARQHGMKDITEQMPADLIRAKLRSRNLTNIKVNAKPLGAAGDGAATPPPEAVNGIEVDYEADLERQFLAQMTQPFPQAKSPAKPVGSMGINELRAECKRIGIKLGRRDNMVTMKFKIENHGKNTP